MATLFFSYDADYHRGQVRSKSLHTRTLWANRTVIDSGKQEKLQELKHTASFAQIRALGNREVSQTRAHGKHLAADKEWRGRSRSCKHIRKAFEEDFVRRAEEGQRRRDETLQRRDVRREQLLGIFGGKSSVSNVNWPR